MAISNVVGGKLSCQNQNKEVESPSLALLSNMKPLTGHHYLVVSLSICGWRRQVILIADINNKITNARHNIITVMNAVLKTVNTL